MGSLKGQKQTWDSYGKCRYWKFLCIMRAETERNQSVKSMKEKKQLIFDWIDFHDTDWISLPRKPKKNLITRKQYKKQKNLKT